ncbi:MFS transporter [Streptomyces sp. NBC_00365]|uniref:MFS transporter n=1 Tax=Streptomyces sp. NBC_00365 TaxID=2975726 RepID=UPI00224DE9F9|nr:MFS transporter [Streptomyces sp. NBC_00365]MCX5096865.1 MFS transporter [Streptomyces sp. NBC_00365]
MRHVPLSERSCKGPLHGCRKSDLRWGSLLRGAVRSQACDVFATLGNVLEWYDFTVYGFPAVHIGATFFPERDGVTSILATFAVFAVGFAARPMGAFVLGPFIDRKGRKWVMLLMASGSLLIGLAPGYAVAGSLGAVVIVIRRLAQGFSADGEFGSSAVFLVEWAHREHRGFFGSFHQVATYGGLLLGVLVTAGLSAALGPTAMHDWSWRVLFVLGALLAVVALFLRRRIEETPSSPRPAIRHPRSPARRSATE